MKPNHQAEPGPQEGPMQQITMFLKPKCPCGNQMFFSVYGKCEACGKPKSEDRIRIEQVCECGCDNFIDFYLECNFCGIQEPDTIDID